MVQWLERNWGKILLAVIPSVFAGIGGFFSAVLATHDKISSINQKVAVLEDLKKDVQNARRTVADNTSSINHLGNRFETLDDKLELEATRVEAIKELTELQRQRTVNELRELLKEYRESFER